MSIEISSSRLGIRYKYYLMSVCVFNFDTSQDLLKAYPRISCVHELNKQTDFEESSAMSVIES